MAFVVIGVIARIIFWLCVAVTVFDAVLAALGAQNILLGIAAVVFFPITFFVWPIIGEGWGLLVIGLVAYAISTLVGRLPPVE